MKSRSLDIQVQQNVVLYTDRPLCAGDEFRISQKIAVTNPTRDRLAKEFSPEFIEDIREKGVIP